jgi:hypothetical protein
MKIFELIGGLLGGILFITLHPKRSFNMLFEKEGYL